MIEREHSCHEDSIPSSIAESNSVVDELALSSNDIPCDFNNNQVAAALPFLVLKREEVATSQDYTTCPIA
jgi:hypothetical protein